MSIDPIGGIVLVAIASIAAITFVFCLRETGGKVDVEVRIPGIGIWRLWGSRPRVRVSGSKTPLTPSPERLPIDNAAEPLSEESAGSKAKSQAQSNNSAR